MASTSGAATVLLPHQRPRMKPPEMRRLHQIPTAANPEFSEQKTAAKGEVNDADAAKITTSSNPPHRRNREYLKPCDATATTHQDPTSQPSAATAPRSETDSANPSHMQETKPSELTPTRGIPCAADSANSHASTAMNVGSVNIREKLSAHGVKVSEAKPATPSEMADKSELPISPESMAKGEPTTHAANNETGGVIVPPQSTSERARGGGGRGRGGRGRGHGPNDRGKQNAARAFPNSGWIKGKDIPKGDSKRFEIDWRSIKSDTASQSSSGNWGRTTKDDWPHIDKETGYQLADWAGNWAPAPVDWDSRPAFRKNQDPESIMQWLNKAVEEMGVKGSPVAIQDFKKSDEETIYFSPRDDQEGGLTSDIAPRSWLPVSIDKKPPAIFWREVSSSRQPEPLDADDLVEVKPWWETYHLPANRECSFLLPYQAPVIAGVDPDEDSKQRRARENDLGADHHAANRRRLERAKREPRARKAEDKNKPRKNKDAKATAAKTLPNAIRPGLSIYIRSAKPTDVKAIRQIYNYYVDNSVSVPETQRRTDKDMLGRLESVQANKLPFLVACERGKLIKNKSKPGKANNNKSQQHGNAYNDGEDILLPDTVVGFASADDYNDMMSMYRFTVEIEIFVSKDALMKNVASCLMDKLLAMLDPRFVAREGYEVRGPDIEGVGAERVVQNCLLLAPFEKAERLEWVKRWLEKAYGFKVAGELVGVGNKLGKSVNLAIFQRTSEAPFDPARPPIMMTYPPINKNG